MIKNISEIKNVGKFVNYFGNQELKKNQIIFGFNGTGKSTLSDVFYSLAYQEEIPDYRKTLEKEDGTIPTEMKVVFNTEDGEILYSEGELWNVETGIYTFNELYIKKFVLVNNDEVENGYASVAIGKEIVKLTKDKQKVENERNQKLEIINSFIINNKIISGDLGIGKRSIPFEHKNINVIKEIRLLPLSQRELEEEKLRDIIASSEEIQTITEEKNKIANLNSGVTNLSSKEITKILKKTPNLSNKELNNHMSIYMKKNNIEWLANGIVNQKNKDLCPFCGQEMKSKEAKKIIANLNKYVTSKTRRNAEVILKEIRELLQVLNYRSTLDTIRIYFEILSNETILKSFKSDVKKRLLLDYSDYVSAEANLTGINDKLWRKSENIYDVILLSDEELQFIQAVSKLFKRIPELKSELDNVYRSIEGKILKDKNLKYKNALVNISYGDIRESFVEVKKCANFIIEANNQLKELNVQIKDKHDENKLKDINNILNSLNVKFRLEVSKRQYYIKLRNYKRRNFDKENPICSDGEARILAFAYFLSEIGIRDGEKTIVIDDPISSLDLSRKSVVSYKIKELFEIAENQIILLTHDISLVEKVKELVKGQQDFSMLEIKNKENVFYPLCLSDYLVDDRKVYENFICSITNDSSEVDKLTALMSMRPLTYIVTPSRYSEIESRSSYFSHTIYSKGKSNNIDIKFDFNHYNDDGLKEYIELFFELNNLECTNPTDAFSGFLFSGFNYEYVKLIYNSIVVNNVTDARKKALFLRIMLEACLFQLTTKQKFDILHIGREYGKVLNSNVGERKKITKKLKELYDLSKKYHHGSETGSTLGLAYINPDEMEFYDEQISLITDWIDVNCEIR